MRASPLVAAAALAVAVASGGSSGQSARDAELVVSSNRAPNLWGEIYAVGADGRNARNLTRSGFDDREAALDPAGRTVAFVSNRSGADAVWTVRVDGSGLRRLTPNVAHTSIRAPAWDRSGSWVLFERAADVYMVPAGGGPATLVLAGGAHPAWGPGDRIAVQVTDESGKTDVHVVTRSGEELWRVAGHSGLWSRGGHLAVAGSAGTAIYDGDGKRVARLTGTLLAWSPRGERAVHATGTSLWVTSVDGTTRRLATTRDPSGFPVAEWSPDGRRVAYLTYAPKTRAEIAYSVDVATGRRTQLAGYGPWAPDGGRIAFASTSGTYSGNVSVADGAQTHVVARAGAPIRWLQWLPSGRRLLYTASWDGGLSADLVDVRPSGGVTARLTSGSYWKAMPAWSPDGTRLAFSRGGSLCNAGNCRRWADNDVWVSRADGLQQRRLTNVPGYRSVDDADPVWSPAGTEIAFVRTRLSSNYTPVDTAIMVVPATGGVSHRVAGGRAPSWSPDGGRLAFVGRGRAISVVNRDGTGLRANGAATARPQSWWVPPGDPQSASQIWAGNVAWSRDGRKLAFVAADGDVYTVSPSGGHPVRVGPAGLGARGDLVWSPDGTRLAYAGDGIHILSIRTGTVLRVDARGGAAKPAWSPDGRRLAYTVLLNGLRSDVVVVPAAGGRAVDVIPGQSVDADPAWRPR